MSFRTNPDRILNSIDRARERAAEAREDFTRQATARELDTELPETDVTQSERVRRVFNLVERTYTSAAGGYEIRRLAQRFQAIGDIASLHARGDVTIAVHFIDADRPDDVGMAPFEILEQEFINAKKTTRTSRTDVNGLRILREHLRDGVQQAWSKVEPRVRDAVRERADMGHVAVQIIMDLRPAG